MNARDELRKYVRLMADMWTSPAITEERTDRVYNAIRAEVLNEAAALIEDRACDADFTEEPLYIVGLRSAADLLKAATPAAVPVPDETAGDETGEEYGLRVTDGGRTAVRFTGPDRRFLAANLDRYRFQYPDAVLVQRTVRYGAWTEVTS